MTTTRHGPPEHPKRLEWQASADPTAIPPCRFCGKALTGRKTSFCGNACIDEWRIRTSNTYARRQVLMRDHQRCSSCQTVDVDWEMDHIVEVVNGGGMCGLENLQTLCGPCHAAKTARLARDRAAARKNLEVKR